MEEKKKQVGRPKTENPNAIKKTIRVSKSLEKAIQHYCIDHEINEAEMIRYAIEQFLDIKK